MGKNGRGGGGSAHDRAVAKANGYFVSKAPSKDTLSTPRHTTSDSLTIVFFLAALLMWAFFPTVLGKIVAVVLVSLGSGYLCYKASWTVNFSCRKQHIYAVVLSLLILTGGDGELGLNGLPNTPTVKRCLEFPLHLSLGLEIVLGMRGNT